MNYYQQQIETLTDGGAYGYSIQVNCNANGDKTTWMNITKEQLKQIQDILGDNELNLVEMMKEREA